MMLAFLMAYWLHSTVLLGVVWCVTKVARTRSPILRERMWKLAAVLPMLTALIVGFRSANAIPVAEPAATAVIASDAANAESEISAIEQSEISRNALASGSDANEPLEPDASAFRLMVVESSDEVSPTPDNSPTAVESELVDEPVLPNVAVIAPRDEPFTVDVETTVDEPLHVEPSVSIEDPTPEGSSRGAMMATLTPPTFDWQPVWHVVSMMSLGWMFVGLIWLVIRSAAFRSRLRKAKRIDRGRVVEIVRELCCSPFVVPPLGGTILDWIVKRFRLKAELQTVERQTRTPRLLIVPDFNEPAAFGIWQPTIVLPPSCEALPRDELRAVLAHELGHIVRGDVWWLLIGRVLTTVLGFQPLNRIARREWTAAAECLCDSWAVDRGVERLTLARCLTALAEHRLTGVSLSDALAAVGSPSSLRTRIERLVAEPVVDPWKKRSRRWLLSSSVLAAAMVTAVMLPLPKALTASVPRPSGSGLNEDHIQLDPLSDGRGTELIHEIETELTALRSELSLAERLAEQQGDPQWLDAAEQLRDRERQLVERWQVLKNESGPVQETGTLIDADHH